MKKLLLAAICALSLCSYASAQGTQVLSYGYAPPVQIVNPVVIQPVVVAVPVHGVVINATPQVHVIAPVFPMIQMAPPVQPIIVVQPGWVPCWRRWVTF